MHAHVHTCGVTCMDSSVEQQASAAGLIRVSETPTDKVGAAAGGAVDIIAKRSLHGAEASNVS